MMKTQLFFFGLFISLACDAQTNHKAYALNTQDRKDYVLSINLKNISNPVEKSWKRQKQLFVKIPLLLKNNSSDTLKFWSMTCSWEDIYETDNKNMVIPGQICDSNFGTVISLAPHQTYKIQISLFLIKNTTVHNYKFRLGMHLFKFQENDSMSYFMDQIVNHKLPKNNLIWSNEAEVPTRY